MSIKQTDAPQFVADLSGGNFSQKLGKEELILDEIVKEFKGAVLELLTENPVRIGTFQA